MDFPAAPGGDAPVSLRGEKITRRAAKWTLKGEKGRK